MTGSAPPDDRLREAIRSHKASLDCFVAEFIIGPAKGRTRWLLAMTKGTRRRGYQRTDWLGTMNAVVDGASELLLR
jgi:hypothetical protein